MTIIDEIGPALIAEKRFLAKLHMPLRPVLSDEMAREAMQCRRTFTDNDVIDAMLRIEASREVEGELSRFIRVRTSCEATKFMNVTIYFVDHPLPDCGWRIINPMRSKS